MILWMCQIEWMSLAGGVQLNAMYLLPHITHLCILTESREQFLHRLDAYVTVSTMNRFQWHFPYETHIIPSTKNIILVYILCYFYHRIKSTPEWAQWLNNHMGILMFIKTNLPIIIFGYISSLDKWIKCKKPHDFVWIM